MEHDYYNLMLINRDVIQDMKDYGWVPYWMGDYAVELNHYWQMMDEIMLCGMSNKVNGSVYDRYWYQNHFLQSKLVIEEYTEMLGYQWIF